MPLSMFDQMLFRLACGHPVILGRLRARQNWKCEVCGRTTDLATAPYSDALAKDRDTADQIDKQAIARGERVYRATT